MDERDSCEAVTIALPLKQNLREHWLPKGVPFRFAFHSPITWTPRP
jgi:hypothetical protein